MTIQEAKDRVSQIRQSTVDSTMAIATARQVFLHKEFIASVAAGTCEDPQRVAKIIDDL